MWSDSPLILSKASAAISTGTAREIFVRGGVNKGAECFGFLALQINR